MYTAVTDEAALAETLLRGLDANDRGSRLLIRERWHPRQLSRVSTTAELTVVTLKSGADLGAIGQDTWLTMCDPDDYPQTREWAHWLRRVDPGAQGIVWLSKREPGVPVLVLFEDRCPTDNLTAAPGPLPGPCRFAEPAGADWLKGRLAPYRVTIRR
jgi:hypothetical protein